MGTNLSRGRKDYGSYARAGVEFERKNPVTFMMPDYAKGNMKPEVLDETVMPAVVEFIVKACELQRTLRHGSVTWSYQHGKR